jgi:tetratricopeptide (TPR) repeat protein
MQHQLAAEWKREGDAAFASGDFQSAIRSYGKALLECGFEWPREKPIIYSRRRQCHFNLGNFALAEHDAKRARELVQAT